MALSERLLRDWHAEDCYKNGFDQHPGAAFFEYLDCTISGCEYSATHRMGWYSEGGGTTNVSNPEHGALISRRASGPDAPFQEHHFPDHPGDIVVYHRDRGGINCEFITTKDVWVESTDSNSISTFFEFNVDSGLDGSMGELTVDHAAIDDTWLTSSNIGNYITQDSDFTIDSISVTSLSDGTTPSEYFDDKFGW